MTVPLLITGLPRSRTAWLSVAATAHDSICHHDITQYLGQWQDIFPFWRGAKHTWTGIADHGLGFHLPEIIERANPRVLIVERPVGQVLASLDRIGIPGAERFCMLLGLALAYEHPNIRRVPYHMLTSTGAVVDCLGWLMPGARIDRERIDALQAMNIQADAGAAKQAAGRPDAAVLALGADVVERLLASTQGAARTFS